MLEDSFAWMCRHWFILNEKTREADIIESPPDVGRDTVIQQMNDTAVNEQLIKEIICKGGVTSTVLT